MILRKISVCLFSLIFPVVLLAQEEPDNRPVRSPFEASTLIDNQTIVSPLKRGLEFHIHHRFGTVENGISDIFGIYAPSNIRLGLDYGITDNLMVGLGTEKDYKLQELHWKYSIFQQTRSGSMPVALSYYGNVVLDLRDSSSFGPIDKYRHIHRFSYFNQLILARRFNAKLSLMLAPGFIYFNAVEKGMNNAHVGLSVGGRYKVTSGMSVIGEYDQLLTKNGAEGVKPNIALGVEFGTATHAFRLFMASYKNIINQRNLVYNTNDFLKGDILFGFNITVRFAV